MAVSVMFVLAMQVPRTALACVPYADAVVAWDIDADLYVVATYHERAVPPRPAEAVFPNLLELRRISSGKQIGVVNCAAEPGAVGAVAARGPCDFRTEFGPLIPKTAGFVPRGKPLGRGEVRVATVPDSRDSGFALMARSRTGGLQNVRWLGQPETLTGERLSLRLGASERRPDAIVIVLESRYRGACNRTEAKLLHLHPIELDATAGPERQKRLLGKLNLSSSFEDWRSAADLRPLPPEKLVFGMVVAAEAGRHDLAARWWTEGTADLPLDRVASLAAALRTRPELEATRQLITLPPEP
jgi:hypothetical protein